MKREKGRNIAVLDLFCGAGGFSEGFRQAGYKIVAGIDNDAESLETFKYNFPEAMAINMDLSLSIDNKKSPLKELFKNKIHVIIGGPPCQGFSIAGKRDKTDPRNNLYKAYLAKIKNFDPIAIVVENVPTILGLYRGGIAQAIVSDFKSLGFDTKILTLLASDYGVPQSRKRTFFVALKNNISFKIPAPTTLFSPITSKMALSDMPLLEDMLGGKIIEYDKEPENKYQREMRKNSDMLYNHWAVEHKRQTIEIIRLVPDGGNYKDLPPHLQSTRKVNIAWTRMSSNKPCFTIDAGHNHHFHYKANRVPTVRECARIQSFPDRFRFLGKKTSQFRQVGNAVPPLLARAIGEELKRGIDELQS
jgi:DNA (cytosine-5)-methyltransferase 1